MRPLPADVMAGLREATAVVMQEQAAADPMFNKVYRSYAEFQQGVSHYHQISEEEYYKNRRGMRE